MRERVTLTSDSHFPFTGGAFGTTKAQILGSYTPFGWVLGKSRYQNDAMGPH